MGLLVGIILTAIIVLPILAFVAWLLMLLLGVLASMLAAPVIALGFAPCFIITLICGLLF